MSKTPFTHGNHDVIKRPPISHHSLKRFMHAPENENPNRLII